MEPRKRILVVDDELLNRELLEALLTGWGHDVDLAKDSDSAMALLSSAHDLILLDVMMPGNDGYEVARLIRNGSCAADTPICMVTALFEMDERLRAVEAGANDFITKPFDKLELKVRTDSLLKVKSAQDVVKRYQVELEAKNQLLQENFEQLNKLGRLKDEFIGMASHDLKNPLACIIGFASIIKFQTKPGTVVTEEMRGWFEKITGHCWFMQQIIEDFLDFQALEDGEFKLTLGELDLNELAREVIERNAGLAKDKSIQLRLEVKPGALLVQVDKSRIDQVLENFVSNAIKFSSPNQHVTISTEQLANSILVEVRDSGPGLTDDDLKLLFVKYAKLSNKPTGGENSTGMGLAICKKIIELQGGTAGARNNSKYGATFWFELPTNIDNNVNALALTEHSAASHCA